MKKTKIICSIGPASVNPDVMEQMVNVGMNVARINFSHATFEEKENVVSAVKEVRKRTKRNVAILYDTKGPEFRNGMMEDNGVLLEEGKEIRIVKEEVVGNKERFSVNHPKAIDSLKIGDIILLENALMKLEVISIQEDGVTCKIVEGGTLGNKKSLNVPGVVLDIPFISENDYEDIVYACEHDGDFVALSFVNTKEDVLEARKICKEHGRSDMKLIAKIESAEGIKNLDEIVKVADGCMVARGDLGVEVPLQTLPVHQKNIVKKCREYGKIAIVATEMLESMKKNIRPTRAEVSDVFNAVIDGTDAVMLSGETTVGKYPIDVVRYMAQICENAENYYNYDYKFASLREVDMTETIAKSVFECSMVLDIKTIVAATTSGYSARRISNLKPKTLVLAICPTEQVARSLALNWGVYAVVADLNKTTDELVEEARTLAKMNNNLNDNDFIIVTGGFPNNNECKKTNFLKIQQI